MKVWLFLAVLKVICTRGQGDWLKGEDIAFDIVWPENAELRNGCEATQDTCHCCSMMQKVHNMRENLNEMVDSLQDHYAHAVQIHEELTQKQSAFSAALFEQEENLQCFGPNNLETTLMYKIVFFDMNNDYNSNSGIFTAPYNGYYIVTVTVFHDAGTPKDDTSCVLVYKNNDIIAGSDDSSTNDHEDSTTLTVAVYMFASDTVQVNVKEGCIICAMDDHYNVFSVFLLYAE